MADEQHIDIISRGVEAWNKWRDENPEVRPDLRFASLSGADLKKANLAGADLGGADLSGASLHHAWLSEANLAAANLSGAVFDDAYLGEANLAGANLSGARLCSANLGCADFSDADLSGANLASAHLSLAKLIRADLSQAFLIDTNFSHADLSGANLSGSDLTRADFEGADLSDADLSGSDLSETELTGAKLCNANLRGANLERAAMVETDLRNAVLAECKVFGVSAWGLELEGAEQKNLIITDNDGLTITVDDLEVAQFIYLIVNNQKLRQVINTVTSKAVLILGRFKPERKVVLDAIRDELRKRDYLPILFDFEKPAGQDYTETITLLARMARFIIADVTEPSSIPQELQAIVPYLAVPVQPLLEGKQPYSMFKDYRKYPWVLKLHRYDGLDDLLASLDEKVIAPSEAEAKAILKRKNEEFE